LKKILIVGASGIIGKYLSQSLNSKYQLTNISRNSNDNPTFFSVDLLKEKSITSFVKNSETFDCLIFLVGLAHKRKKNKKISDYRDVNFLTLKNLLSILKSHNKIPEKLIFASTISVYREKIDKNIYYEKSKTLPKSYYAITKLEAEDYLLNNYYNQSWILRLAPVYSRKFNLNIDRRIKFLNFGFRVGDGMSKISLCQIENIKFAVEAIIDEKVPLGLYNISDSIDYNYNQLHSYNKIRPLIRIPRFIVKIIYIIAKMFNLHTIEEFSIKLISDNIYPSRKFRKFSDLPSSIGS